MRGISEFQIIGRVGQIKEVGNTLRVTLAAEYGRTDDKGDFQKNTFWNEVTIFNEKRANWIRENVSPGDLAHARGTIRQTEYEKNGQTIYGVTLAVEEFERLVQQARLKQESDA